MKYFKTIGLFLVGICFLAPAPSAEETTVTGPLLCATTRVIECSESGGCAEISLKDVNMPRFFTVDLAKNEIRTIGMQNSGKVSRIERQETIDGKLILQGAEDGIEGVRDGVGWTLSISEDSGGFVLSACGDQVAFIAFGASTVQP